VVECRTIRVEVTHKKLLYSTYKSLLHDAAAAAGNAHKIYFPLFFPISDRIAYIQILTRGQEHLST
jgi:hypothetical protein